MLHSIGRRGVKPGALAAGTTATSSSTRSAAAATLMPCHLAIRSPPLESPVLHPSVRVPTPVPQPRHDAFTGCDTIVDLATPEMVRTCAVREPHGRRPGDRRMCSGLGRRLVAIELGVEWDHPRDEPLRPHLVDLRLKVVDVVVGEVREPALLEQEVDRKS